MIFFIDLMLSAKTRDFFDLGTDCSQGVIIKFTMLSVPAVLSVLQAVIIHSAPVRYLILTNLTIRIRLRIIYLWLTIKPRLT